MTATLPPPVADRPSPGERPSPGDEVRVVTVVARLLPEEIVAGRRLAALKRKLAIGLAALLGLLVLGYGLSWWGTHSANGDLAAENQRATTLQNAQKAYQPLVDAQAQANAISTTLSTLMTGDLQWPALTQAVRKACGSSISFTGITGSIDSASAVAGSTQGTLPVLNQTGETGVGSLTLNGSATDKDSVAMCVDKLGHVTGLAAPYPASVSGPRGKVVFTINVLLTTKALGGRFAPATAGTNGGH